MKVYIMTVSGGDDAGLDFGDDVECFSTKEKAIDCILDNIGEEVDLDDQDRASFRDDLEYAGACDFHGRLYEIKEKEVK